MERQPPTDPDRATSRVPIYENQALCTLLLNSVTAAVPLQILPSKIAGAGTGLFVTRDVDIGEEIFRSRPVVNCVDTKIQKLVCDYCYNYSESSMHPSEGRFLTPEDPHLKSMMACSGCRVCYYCTKNCQKYAWKEYHKHECALFSDTPQLPTLTQALYRILCKGENRLISLEEQLGLGELESHAAEYASGADMVQIAAAAHLARIRVGTTLSDAHVATLLCILRANCMIIRQAEGRPLGMSVDLVSSLINHSCDPNAFVVFERHTPCVRSLRKLVAGEEITQCYADVSMDVLSRQQVLKSKYFFDCRCERCVCEIQSHQVRFPGLFEQIKQCQEQLVNYSKALSPEDADNVLQNARNIAKGAFPDSHWPEDLPPWPGMRNLTANLLILRGRPKAALLQGVKGYMLLEPRTGDVWVRNFLNFVLILLANVMQSGANIPCDDPAFPTDTQLRDILLGCLYELNLAAKRAFGSQAGYSQAVQVLYSNHMESAGTPLPGTSAFAQRFMSAQSKLLLWAGVDEDKGITLSS